MGLISYSIQRFRKIYAVPCCSLRFLRKVCNFGGINQDAINVLNELSAFESSNLDEIKKHNTFPLEN